MTAPRLLLVAGLGRCGTTMVMQMLNAGGLRCAGTWPAFEDIPFSPSRVDQGWVAEQDGRAVKWIDPTATPPFAARGAAIYLTRDTRQQAASIAKLLGINLDRAGRRALRSSLDRDNPRALLRVAAMVGPENVMRLTFEQILDDPAATARRLSNFSFARRFPMPDVDLAAAAVVRRSPRCAPDLSMEARIR